MTLLDWLVRMPQWARLSLVSLVALLIGFLDHVTGLEIAVSILFLVPVANTAWGDGGVAGACMSLFCGVIWLAADLTDLLLG